MHYLIDVQLIINVSSQGELSCNGHEVRVFDFLTETSTRHVAQHKAPVAFGLGGHGVADYHLIDSFVNAIAVSCWFSPIYLLITYSYFCSGIINQCLEHFFKQVNALAISLRIWCLSL